MNEEGCNLDLRDRALWVETAVTITEGEEYGCVIGQGLSHMVINFWHGLVLSDRSRWNEILLTVVPVWPGVTFEGGFIISLIYFGADLKRLETQYFMIRG